MTKTDTPKVVTLAQLQKSRTIVATAPSGVAFKIRPLNMERYALAGGLPATLREIALKGADGVNAMFTDDGSDMLTEHGEEMQEYMDSLVRQLVVEPSLSDVDLDVLMPVDYRWLVSVAMGDEDRDGEGKRLWGKDSLTTWATFREFHGCDEDCSQCSAMVNSLASVQQGQGD